MTINWENYRTTNGSLDIWRAFEDSFSQDEIKAMSSSKEWNAARIFLDELQGMSLIKSRQTASLAVATARYGMVASCLNQ